MNRFRFVFVSLFLFCTVLNAYPQDHKSVFYINTRAPHHESLMLKSVTIDEKQTTLLFSLAGPGWGRVWKRGTENAFFLRGENTGKKYDILDAKGISWAPEKTQLSEGQSIDFVVIFEHIDPVDKEISLIEGNENYTGKSWSIKNIKLK